MLAFLVRHAEIDTVFLVGALADRDLDAIAEGYTETVTALAAAGKSVVLVYPVPRPGFDVPHTLARHLLGGDALYFDDNHLSIAGARRVGPLFDRYLDRPM